MAWDASPSSWLDEARAGIDMRHWIESRLGKIDRDKLAFSGILIFALSSVYAISQLLIVQAKHPHWIYYLPATFVEIVTAITIWQTVEMFYKWSRSNQTKQDKRFYGTIAVILVILVMPSVITSIIANYWEFRGFVPYAEQVFPVLLGLLCPLMAIICAVLGGISKAVQKREASLAKQLSKASQSEPKTLRKERKSLSTSKRRDKVFALYCQDLDQSPAALGKRFGVTAQTIRNDLDYLAKQGRIVYKDGRVSLRPQKLVAKGEP
jgi:NADH:ubiquinone oxidoreductase subunit 5 (subunit L)/multisubunit Na+/H+ antiporter MnhA subunit